MNHKSFNFSAKVFEEEDFDPRDYGYVLTPDILNTKACFMLKDAEDELTKKAKSYPDGTEVYFFQHQFPIMHIVHANELFCIYL